MKKLICFATLALFGMLLSGCGESAPEMAGTPKDESSLKYQDQQSEKRGGVGATAPASE